MHPPFCPPFLFLVVCAGDECACGFCVGVVGGREEQTKKGCPADPPLIPAAGRRPSNYSQHATNATTVRTKPPTININHPPKTTFGKLWQRPVAADQN